MDLYALPPEQFTATRDAEAKAARAGGDRDRAKELAALRRPALSSYAVNALVRREPALLEDLLALGPQLAAAQSGGDAAALRALGEQRRALIAAVAERAQVAADRPLSSTAREEVAATLEAALADPASADAVRSGRLVRPLSYAGFGPVDLSEAVGPPVAGAPTAEPGQAPEAGASGKSVGRARGRAGRVAPGAMAWEPAAAKPGTGDAAVTPAAGSAATKPGPTAKERQAQERERQAQERERQAQERRLQAVREAEATALAAGGRLDDAASAMTAAERAVESAAAALEQAQHREAAAAAALEDATAGRTAAQAALREARRHADGQAAGVRRAQARSDDARRALDALRRG